ncbi:glycoside hydrolase family 15 protein [Methylobrevis pamukkalensis]|uniref:glucan 1,4-alpha-glucosidase n=1 Tax=Methylobrevis pamukkalensis TaxID=1439726 RepID=A0A1E3H405_9HYPH|nr:glycoside hydrolase family 15 protein [Methylobrevis pamukkalensis]ODN70261.1 Glycosyl hydrolases family 15 [Methylobrevis pamukkalensis]
MSAASPGDGLADLDRALARQAAASRRHLAASLSRTDLVHVRPEFGQRVQPAAGSVLASPVSAHWDPEPDYFYHWTRDAAIVMAEVARLAAEGDEGGPPGGWARAFADYVAFSLATTRLAGAGSVPNPLRPTTRADCLKHLRSDQELAGVSGDTILAEPRVNPDGSTDLQRWARPQHDGPALRALTLLEHLASAEVSPAAAELLAVDLLETDLGFTLRQAGSPCIGPWEEDDEFGHHYFTGVCQLGALVRGADRLAAAGLDAQAGECRTAADALRRALDGHFDPQLGVYRAIAARGGATDAHQVVDACQVMAVLHAGLEEGRHSVLDDRLQASVHALAAAFCDLYPVNHGSGTGFGPLVGRSVGDRYFGGNPWFPTSFALAEFHYALAKRLRDGAALPETGTNLAFRRGLFGDTATGDAAAALAARGDAVLAATLAHAGPDGEMSEQIDRTTGAQLSARQLTWSHAALLSVARARAQLIVIPAKAGTHRSAGVTVEIEKRIR